MVPTHITAEALATDAAAALAQRALASSGDTLWDWDLGTPAELASAQGAWVESVHPEDRHALLQAIAAHRADPGRTCEAEFRLQDAAGRWAWRLGRGRIEAHGTDGTRLRLLGLLTDIDAQRSRLNALELSRARFQAIYETTPDAMGITRIADGKYLDVNRGFEGLTGFSRSEAVGRTSTELGIWATVADRMALVEAFRRDGAVDSLEMCVRHRGGRQVDGLMSVRGLRIDGEDCFLFTYRDISEHKRMQAEAARAQSEKAAALAASQAKTDFLSRMSHELRTPLNAVLGFSQLLMADPAEPLTERQSAQVEAIRQAGWHLLALINDVLDVSRIEAGRLAVAPRSVDLVALLDEVASLVGPQADAWGVTLQPAYRRHAPLAVTGDPVRVRQVLLNVITNAVKYNRPGGQARIEAARTPHGVAVQVVDSGLGMTRDQLEHLFEPFNRLGRERSGIEGTGIGMALTRQLVELMEGSIEVRSEAGRGTTVRVTLPEAAQRPDPEADSEAATPAGAGRPATAEACEGTILYVEDNAVNQLIVRQMLARWPGLRLVMADNGARGIALARELAPDLVLLDMRLPDMTGTEVLDALRADPATRALRVVALSASAMPDEVTLARDRGALEYWTKPLDYTTFLADVQRLVCPTAALRVAG